MEKRRSEHRNRGFTKMVLGLPSESGRIEIDWGSILFSD
jgi:hypothetical protein